MTLTLSWLDYSDHERRKMLDVNDLFWEKSTPDEPGRGGVREAIADLLFQAQWGQSLKWPLHLGKRSRPGRKGSMAGFGARGRMASPEGEPPPVQGLAVVAEVLRLIVGDSGSGGGDSFA